MIKNPEGIKNKIQGLSEERLYPLTNLLLTNLLQVPSYGKNPIEDDIFIL